MAHQTVKEEIEQPKERLSAFDRQEGGNHYLEFAIQPAVFCQVNKIGFMESNVIKYVCRHKHKNGIKDIKKAIHYLEMLLETEYNS